MSDAAVQRLIDRAEISDLLLAFGRALDAKDWDAYATAQSYLLAIHVPDATRPAEHADVGGTYRCECVRTAEGWRFARVEIEVWWTAGTEFAIEHEPAAS